MMKSEINRINSVYKQRSSQKTNALYKWHLDSSQYASSIKNRMISSLVFEMFGDNLSNLSVLDVGCGNGSFLRRLIEYGVIPCNLMGTEYIEDRVLSARSLTHAEVKFHLGPLVELIKDRKYDLVCAHTVFSSILSSVERQELAKQMWDRVRPGGVIMIFDFRYNNPKNKRLA